MIHADDNSLSEEQRLMRESCRAFVDDLVTPFIRQNWRKEWDMSPEGRLPASILEGAEKIGVRTLGVPVAHGGIELERINGRLQGGMAFLATVGAICPFVGLFGTVWGIVNALIRITQSGDASIEKVAGPVGEALIMTAIGLAVAVPAVIFYNLLGRRNKNISDAARHFAYDIDKLMASSAKA